MRKKSNFNTDFVKGYKVRIYPTEAQKLEIKRNIQVSRAVYNLGLEMQNKSHNEGNGFIKYYPLITKFSDMRNNDKEFSWMKSVSVNTIRETLHHLDYAFQRFFNKTNNYPKFKSRKRSKKNFTVRSDRTHIKGDYIQISGLNDKMVYAKNHHIPEGKRLHNTVVSYDGYDGYWFSCTIESDPINMSDIPISEPIGIDVGIVNMITTSDGNFYKFTDTSKINKQMKRLQRRLSKDYSRYINLSIDTRTKYDDIPKSKNYYKRAYKAFKTAKRLHNIKMNDIHNATKKIVDKNPSAIVIETISVREQQKDKWIRRYNPQMMYYEIHRQIQYKAHNRNIPVIKADKDYASSKLCSKCGERGYIKNKTRTFICPHCGYHEDRDLNAAYNLKKLAYQVPNENNIVLSIDA